MPNPSSDPHWTDPNRPRHPSILKRAATWGHCSIDANCPLEWPPQSPTLAPWTTYWRTLTPAGHLAGFSNHSPPLKLTNYTRGLITRGIRPYFPHRATTIQGWASWYGPGPLENSCRCPSLQRIIKIGFRAVSLTYRAASRFASKSPNRHWFQICRWTGTRIPFCKFYAVLLAWWWLKTIHTLIFFTEGILPYKIHSKGQSAAWLTSEQKIANLDL